jgi:hypothetical protein
MKKKTQVSKAVWKLFQDLSTKSTLGVVEIARTEVGQPKFNITVYKKNPSPDVFTDCVVRSKQSQVNFAAVFNINPEISEQIAGEIKWDVETHRRVKRAMVTSKSIFQFEGDIKDWIENFLEEVPTDVAQKLKAIPAQFESEARLKAVAEIVKQMPVKERKKLVRKVYDTYFHRFKDLGISPWAVIYSGNGFHLYFYCSNPIDTTDSEFFKAFYNRVCEKIESSVFCGKVKLDRSFCNPAQLLRVPMSVNWKKGNDPDHPKKNAAIEPELWLHQSDSDCAQVLPEWFLSQRIEHDKKKVTVLQAEGTREKSEPLEPVVEDYKEKLRAALTFQKMLEYAGYSKMETLSDAGGGETKLSSPWSADHTPSCFFNEEKGLFHCFSTHHEGDKFKFLALLMKLDCKKEFVEILSIASKITGVTPLIFSEVEKGKDAEFTRIENFILKKKSFYEVVKKKFGKFEFEFAQRLTNFLPQIRAKETHTDGMTVKRFLKITGTLEDGRILPELTLASSELMSLDWVCNQWSSDPQIYVVDKVRDKIRLAMQMTSGVLPETIVYNHTGWRKIEGEWYFLHAGGAVGREGNRSDITVRLSSEKLNSYCLPDPVRGEELQSAIRASLQIACVDTKAIGASLLGAAYLAPLGEMMSVDFSVFSVGETGTLKSTLTGVVQAHFGKNFNVTHLPGNWMSTDNALEKTSFVLKDVIYTIDEFKPQGSEREVYQLNAKADRIMRGSANKQGRGRLDKNLTSRDEYYCRGLIVATGEVLPKNHSLRARLWDNEVNLYDLKNEAIQPLVVAAREGVYAQAMSGYVSWLASRVDSLKETLPSRKEVKRDELTSLCGPGSHRRTPEILSQLMIAYETFTRFAVEAGAIDHEESTQILSQTERLLLSTIDEQLRAQADNDPTKQFFTLLNSILISGRGHLVNAKDGKPPENPTAYGWRTNGTTLSLYSDTPIDTYTPCGDKLGWIGEGEIYLEPGTAFKAVRSMARSQGVLIVEDQRTVFKRMRERGFLMTSENDCHRNTMKKRVEGKPQWVIAIKAEFMNAE